MLRLTSNCLNCLNATSSASAVLPINQNCLKRSDQLVWKIYATTTCYFSVTTRCTNKYQDQEFTPKVKYIVKSRQRYNYLYTVLIIWTMQFILSIINTAEEIKKLRITFYWFLKNSCQRWLRRRLVQIINVFNSLDFNLSLNIFQGGIPHKGGCGGRGGDVIAVGKKGMS